MTLLLAKISDLASIEALMKRSMQILGIGHYSPEQIDACSQFVCVPDKQLVEDQTYYVMEENGILIGCGGWSFRNKLYAGPADTPQKSDRLYCEAVNFFILTCVKAPGFVYQKEGSIINTASFLIDEPRGFDA
ncbi:MAG TPA: hypothetical protein VFU89_03270, partial [Rhabdochlamydiaceae bacterium]|nr:hypothetical protein [Rhabdochlamydiaceae bacterium]